MTKETFKGEKGNFHCVSMLFGGIMIAAIGKWGNGAGLRIPQPFLKQLGLAIGDAITFRVTEKEIIITKSGPTLEELLSQCTAENRHSEVFSDSCGKELL